MPASLISETMERERERIPLEGAYNLACNLHSMFLNNDSLSNLDCLSSYDGEHRGKKSQNTTECVPVPSSEHVAEIVGRQGCKIKALRAKTNTYIKTPVRGEEPVFVVTGRKEDVCAAKREICSAADHFSQIRAQRKSNSNGTLVPGPNSSIPGQKTIQVRVPYRVVGLVVGPKGATIKRIQQTTNTYIVTPSRDKEPVFDVTGLPDNVECARKEIEAHIAMRTGGSVDDPLEDYSANGLDALSSVSLNVISNSYFKNDFGSSGLISPYTRENLLDITNTENMFSYNGSMASRNTKNLMGSSMFGSYLAFSSGYEADDSTISPTFDGHTTSSSWPDFCTTASSSPEGDGRFNSAGSTLSDLSQRSNSLTGGLADLLSGSDPSHPSARRTHSDPMTQEVNTILSHLNLGVTPFGSSAFSAAVSKCTTTGSSRSSPIDVLAPGSRPKRECLGCFESEVVAALIPCGHNNFCMECAQRMCEERTNCPVCETTPTNAMRIYH